MSTSRPRDPNEPAPMGTSPTAGSYGGGPGGAAEAIQAARGQIRTPETKEFLRTSEFFVWLLMMAATFISAAAQDNFDAPQAWLFVTVITAAYIVSRGIAKAGARRAEPDYR